MPAWSTQPESPPHRAARVLPPRAAHRGSPAAAARSLRRRRCRAWLPGIAGRSCRRRDGSVFPKNRSLASCARSRPACQSRTCAASTVSARPRTICGVASMSKDGWLGKPIDVVAMPDGTLASIDNTRVLAARMANIDVKANVRGFDELINDPVRQASLTGAGNVPETWGDAALLRLNKPIQNATYPSMNPSWSTRFPYGSLYDPEVKH